MSTPFERSGPVRTTREGLSTVKRSHRQRTKLAPPPSPRSLWNWANVLRYEWEDLTENHFKRCAAILDEAAQWIDAARRKRSGRPLSQETWSAVWMVHRLRERGHVDNDADAIAAVVGSRKGAAYELVRRKLHDWRKGKRPRHASIDMKVFKAVLKRLPRTHRIK